MELSPVSLGMAAGAAVLTLISIWLCYDGAGRLIRKMAFRTALEGHDSTEYGLAVDKLETVIKWDAQNPLPRILMAKIHVEKGEDAEAQELYSDLIAKGEDTAHPEIHAGIGVMYLRQADKEKASDKAAKLLSDAEAAFGKAGALPEAGVGRATARLLRALRSGGARADAAKEFGAALEAAKVNPPGREGIEDLYAGLAVASFDPAKWNKQGYEAAKSYHTFNAKSETALANIMFYEAQFLDQLLLKPASDAEVGPLWAEIVKRVGVFIKPQYALIKDSETREALMDYNLAAVLWMTDKARYQDALGFMLTELNRSEFYATLQNSWLYLYFSQNLCAARPFEGQPNAINTLYGLIESAIAELSRNEGAAKQNPDYLPLALQFQALGDYTIWKNTGDLRFLPRAEDALARALKLAPDDYRIQRNLAYTYWAGKKVDEATKLIPKLEEAAKTTEEKADLEEVKKYLKDQ